MSFNFTVFLCVIVVLLFWLVIWWQKPKDPQSLYDRYMSRGLPPIKHFTYAKTDNGYNVFSIDGHKVIGRTSDRIIDLQGNVVKEPTFSVTNHDNGFVIDGVDYEFKCPDKYHWNGQQCIENPLCNNEPGTKKRYKNYERGYVRCGEGTNATIEFCTGYTKFNGTDCVPYDPCIDLHPNDTHTIGIDNIDTYYICQGNTSIKRACPDNHLFVQGVGCVELNQCKGIPDGTLLKINDTTFVMCEFGKVGKVSKCPPNTTVDHIFNCAEVCHKRVTKWWTTDYFNIPIAGVICPDNKEISCGTGAVNLPLYNPKIPLDIKYWNEAYVDGKCQSVVPEKYSLKKYHTFTYPPTNETLEWNIFTNRPKENKYYFLIGDLIYDYDLTTSVPIKDVIPIVGANTIVRLDTNPYFDTKVVYVADKYAVGLTAAYTMMSKELFLYGLVKITTGWRLVTVHAGEVLVIDAEKHAILEEAIELNGNVDGAYCPPAYKVIPELSKLMPDDTYLSLSICFIDAYGRMIGGYGHPQWTAVLTKNYKLALINRIALGSENVLDVLKSITLNKWPDTTTYPDTIDPIINRALHYNSESWIIPDEAETIV